MNRHMTNLIATYIQDRAKAKLEIFDKAADSPKRSAQADHSGPLIADVTAKRAELVAQFAPAAWLSDAAILARQIRFVTHPLKFTHPYARGSSVYAKSVGVDPDRCYLTTAALLSPDVDTVGNAAALAVGGLLRLQHDGMNLAELIVQGDMSAFQPFAQNESQLEDWRDGFRQVLVDKDLRSHSFAKQIYFPVSDSVYHLLSPLYASSLAHAVYKRVTDSRYTDAAKAARQARREGKYSTQHTTDYTHVAVQTFGGTQPQNVSRLNSGRRGKSFLFSCKPPSWTVRLLPPSHGKNAFWNEYDRRAWRTAGSLKAVLLKSVSLTSTKVRRDIRADYVDQLVDMLFQYAAEIRGLVKYAGWSADSQLSRPEQLWLDPLRDDEIFQAERQTKDWQQDIAGQFARWLNRKLKDKNLAMADAEYQEWSKLLARRLASLKEDLEAMVV